MVYENIYHNTFEPSSTRLKIYSFNWMQGTIYYDTPLLYTIRIKRIIPVQLCHNAKIQ